MTDYRDAIRRALAESRELDTLAAALPDTDTATDDELRARDEALADINERRAEVLANLICALRAWGGSQ